MKTRQLRNKREFRPVNVVRNALEATIYLYDEIDSFWGIGAKDVIAALDQVSDAQVLHLRINSPGGDVFEGQAISEAIRRFAGKTIAHIDSLAASAASSIAIAADEVEMSPGAFFMIHNASGIVMGDKKDMRDTADLLEKVEGTIVQGYVNKTGKDAADVVALMDAETWFTAEEAVANGFADRVSAAPVKAANKWTNLQDVYKNAPQEIADPELPAGPVINPVEPEPVGTSQTNQNRLRMAEIA
jgi:ATP-dependent Clp protease protease subunit